MPWLETDGIETYYEDYGDGHPIIVLHGAMDNHKVWAEQLQPLTDEYRIITYDLRGHGKTDSGPREKFTATQYVNDLVSMIETLNLDSPTVLGHSFGGMIGYIFASEHSEKLSSLVTVGAATPQTFTTSEWVMRIGLPKVITPILGNDRVMEGVLWAQEQLFGEDSTVDLSEMDRVRETHTCEVSTPEETDRSNTMRAVLDYMDTEFVPDRMSPKTMMMYGENEPTVENHAHYLDDHLGNCRTVEVPEASHNSQVDNPEFIRSQIRGFLADISEKPE